MDKRNNQAFSKLFTTFQLGASYFSEHYMRAVKKGAYVAEKKILESVDDRDQSDEIKIGKLVEAIKLGALNAAEHMLLFGIDFIKQMKSK